MEQRTILVLGANGRLGRAVVNAILKDDNLPGAVVRAGVRHGQNYNFRQDRVKTVVADLEDRHSLEAAIDGVTAVICTIASPRGRAMTPTMGQYFENLMEAMIKKGVVRLLAVSCISATPEGLESLPFEQKCCIFGNSLKGMSNDMTKFEEFLAKNRTQRLSYIEEYTVIRFPNLVNGRAISNCHIAVGVDRVPEKIKSSMPLENAAIFLVDILKSNSWHLTSIYVGLRKKK